LTAWQEEFSEHFGQDFGGGKTSEAGFPQSDEEHPDAGPHPDVVDWTGS
jgi:hypothetical protein